MADRYREGRNQREDRQQVGYYGDDYGQQNEQFSQPQMQPGDSYQADYDNAGYRDEYRGSTSRQGYGSRSSGPNGSRDYDSFEVRDRNGYRGQSRGSRSFADDDRSRNFDSQYDRQYGGNYEGRGYADRSSRGSSRNRMAGGYGSNNAQYDRDDRGFFDRAGDEVASWFGDEDAERRREMDHRMERDRSTNSHRGRGPKNYSRSDERLLEEACENLTRDHGIDASDMEVTVSGGELTLDGKVNTRWEKRRAEDCVHDISGVNHVQNNLRIRQTDMRAGGDENTRSGRKDSTGETLA